MSALERYLRLATRGLTGQARRAAMQELRGHIAERVLDLRAAGLGESEALDRTLRELGAPEPISAQLAWVHARSPLTRSPAALVLIAGALLLTPGVRPAPPARAVVPPPELGFQARPYILGTAKPVPIPTCFDVRLEPNRTQPNVFECKPAKAPAHSLLQRLLGR